MVVLFRPTLVRAVVLRHGGGFEVRQRMAAVVEDASNAEECLAAATLTTMSTTVTRERVEGKTMKSVGET